MRDAVDEHLLQIPMMRQSKRLHASDGELIPLQKPNDEESWNHTERDKVWEERKATTEPPRIYYEAKNLQEDADANDAKRNTNKESRHEG